MPRVGRLIVVEGLDGSGKSTFVRALCAALDAIPMATPDGGLKSARLVLDSAYRDHPVAEQLFYASSVVHGSSMARGHIASGRDVVMDRYWASTVVYAGLRAASVSLESVERALLPADVTFWLDVPEAVRLGRLNARAAGGEALTHADLQTMAPTRAEELRQRFLATLRGPLHGRVVATGGDVAAAVSALGAGAGRTEAGDQPEGARP